MNTKLKISISLISDAIFSSGCSVAGGDDINVYTDELGYPYFKGTSFKGLHRENMQMLVDWSGLNSDIITTLFGEESLKFTDDNRRLKFTSFTLDTKTNYSEEIFSKRTFTSIEDGAAKEGSLRSAKIINRGLTFTGEIFCDKQDVELINAGINATKWIGSMKNRGFGRVKITTELIEISANKSNSQTGNCIYYRIKTLMPVQITSTGGSKADSYQTLDFITGASIRGLLLNKLSDSDFLKQNKNDLLTNKTRFLNTTPYVNGNDIIPTILGFYEEKNETGLENIIVNGTFKSGKKRAKLGSFCSVEGDIIHYTSVKKGNDTRIAITDGDNKIFSSSYIQSGQEFEGYILLDNPNLAGELISSFDKEFFIGADKNEGFGKCELLEIKVVDNIKSNQKYSFQKQEELTHELYLFAMSPFAMTNTLGDVCGINLDVLSDALEVKVEEIQYCATSTSEYFGFNNKWKARTSYISMYNQGCIFKLICDSTPSLDKLKNLEKTGIGVRTAEGFGQILFIKNDIITKIKDKKSIAKNINSEIKSISEKRGEKIRYIMNTSNKIVNMKTSKSQLGELQTICENNNLDDLNAFLIKKTNDNYPKIKANFIDIKSFIEDFLENEFTDISNKSDKLPILCELFNYSRKEK